MPRLLLLSSSMVHGSGYFQWCSEAVISFFSKCNVDKILFIPYAVRDYDKYADKVRTAFDTLGLKIESIHEKPNPITAVNECKGIFIGGGNTFLFLKTLYDNQLIDPIRQSVLERSVPYMGSSAGTNVATVNICTTNDMPICYPPSFEALNFVPFNINPHYIDADINTKHMGESREQRIKEYHENKDSPPVLGLKEGSFVLIENEKIVLKGLTSAKLFERGKEPLIYEPGADLSFLFDREKEPLMHIPGTDLSFLFSNA